MSRERFAGVYDERCEPLTDRDVLSAEELAEDDHLHRTWGDHRRTR